MQTNLPNLFDLLDTNAHTASRGDAPDEAPSQTSELPADLPDLPSAPALLDVMALADAKHAFQHRMTLAGYRAVLGPPPHAWDERAARRACNVLLGRPASDRPRSHTCDPEPSVDDWRAAVQALRAWDDAGLSIIPALEGLMPV